MPSNEVSVFELYPITSPSTFSTAASGKPAVLSTGSEVWVVMVAVTQVKGARSKG